MIILSPRSLKYFMGYLCGAAPGKCIENPSIRVLKVQPGISSSEGIKMQSSWVELPKLFYVQHQAKHCVHEWLGCPGDTPGSGSNTKGWSSCSSYCGNVAMTKPPSLPAKQMSSPPNDPLALLLPKRNYQARMNSSRMKSSEQLALCPSICT